MCVVVAVFFFRILLGRQKGAARGRLIGALARGGPAPAPPVFVRLFDDQRACSQVKALSFCGRNLDSLCPPGLVLCFVVRSVPCGGKQRRRAVLFLFTHSFPHFTLLRDTHTHTHKHAQPTHAPQRHVHLRRRPFPRFPGVQSMGRRPLHALHRHRGLLSACPQRQSGGKREMCKRRVARVKGMARAARLKEGDMGALFGDPLPAAL